MLTRRSPTIASAAFAVFVAIFSQRGEAQSYEDAMQLYASGDLDRSAQAFTGALESGSLTRSQVAAVHLHLGILHVANGRTEDARRSFRAAICLEPNTPAPTELDPDGRTLFENEKRVVVPLSLEGAVRTEPPELVVTTRTSEHELVAKIVVRAGATEMRRTVSATTTSSSFSLDATVVNETASIQALDSHGNVVAEKFISLGGLSGPTAPESSGALAAAERPAARPHTRRENSNETAFYEKTWFWIALGSVAVAAAGVGVAVAWTAEDEHVLGGVRWQ